MSKVDSDAASDATSWVKLGPHDPKVFGRGVSNFQISRSFIHSIYISELIDNTGLQKLFF